MTTIPNKVKCPACDALPMQRCLGVSHSAGFTHEARWKAVGVLKPTREQKKINRTSLIEHYQMLQTEKGNGK